MFGGKSADVGEIDFGTQLLAKLHQHPAEVQKTATFFEFDQKVDIAVGRLLSAGNRSEKTDVDGAVPPGDMPNRISLAVNFGCSVHVVSFSCPMVVTSRISGVRQNGRLRPSLVVARAHRGRFGCGAGDYRFSIDLVVL